MFSPQTAEIAPSLEKDVGMLPGTRVRVEGMGEYPSQEGQVLSRVVSALPTSAIWNRLTHGETNDPDQIRFLQLGFASRVYEAKNEELKINFLEDHKASAAFFLGRALGEICAGGINEQTFSVTGDSWGDFLVHCAMNSSELDIGFGLDDLNKQFYAEAKELIDKSIQQEQVVIGPVPREAKMSNQKRQDVKNARRWIRIFLQNLSGKKSKELEGATVSEQLAGIDKASPNELKTRGYKTIVMAVHGVGSSGQRDFEESGVRVLFEKENIPFICPTFDVFGSPLESFNQQYNYDGTGKWSFANLGYYYAQIARSFIQEHDVSGNEKFIFTLLGTSRGALLSPFIVHHLRRENPDLKIAVVADSGPFKSEKQKLPVILDLALKLVLKIGENKIEDIAAAYRDNIELFKNLKLDMEDLQDLLSPDTCRRLRIFEAILFKINWDNVVNSIPKDVPCLVVTGRQDGLILRGGEAATTGVPDTIKQYRKGGHVMNDALGWLTCTQVVWEKILNSSGEAKI